MTEAAPTVNAPSETLLQELYHPYPPDPEALRIMATANLAAIRDQVNADIRDVRGGSPAWHVNNFGDNFRGGRRRDPEYTLKHLDRLGPDAHRHDPTKWDEKTAKLHSERMATATWRQFHTDIDTAIHYVEQCGLGITRDNLLTLMTARTSGRLIAKPQGYVELLSPAAQEAYYGKFNGNIQEALALDLLEAEIAMLALGYTRYDLSQ